MDKEERKQYNKIYYSLHRERILSYLCEKVSCEYCGRCVIKNNLVKHQKSEICKRHRERVLELNDFLTRRKTISSIAQNLESDVTIKDE